MLRDIFVFVRVLKKYDIFTNWSSWSVVGSIVLSKLWLAYGLSSNQIRTNNVRNVVLLAVVPRAYTIITLVWPILSHCSHNGGSPVIWKFRWVVVEPISSILSPPWFMLNIELVLELLQSLPSCSAHEVYVWVKEVTFSKSTCIRCKLPPWIWERIVLFPLESSQISHAYVRSIIWFGRLITSTPYVFLAHQATDWLVQGEEVPS